MTVTGFELDLTVGLFVLESKYMFCVIAKLKLRKKKNLLKLLSERSHYNSYHLINFFRR